MKNSIKEYIEDSISTKNKIVSDENFLNTIKNAAEKIIEAYNNGNKVFFTGNGGSAADAQHLATELVCKFCSDRIALPAIALTTNTSTLTAIGNDYGFDKIFARQIEALGNSGDILIAISTSGNSKNIINAIEEAKKKNLYIIGFIGNNDCKMDSICDLLIKIPSSKTSIIQESHIMIGHILCEIVEKALC